MVVNEPDERVLDAVAAILERDGLAGLSMTAIAEEAELSRVTLHRRKATIDDYVIAVLGRVSDELRRALWPVLTGAGDAAGRLRTALEVLCAVVDRHAGVFASFYGRPAWPLPGRPERTTSFEFIEPFERIIRDGLADGTLCSDDPRRDATLVANTVAWSFCHLRRAHSWPADTAASDLVALAMAAVDPSRPAVPRTS